MTSTERLIAALANDAAPVRPLRPPLLRAALWLAFAAAVAGALWVGHGPRPDLRERLAETGYWLPLAATVLAGVLATIAAFMVALPDRSPRWMWLPVPALAVWLGSVGTGCLTDWVRLDATNELRWGNTARCFLLILLASVPLSGVLLAMLRRTVPLRPHAATLAAGAAAGAMTSAIVQLMHRFDASALVLAWNFGTLALVLVIDAAVGRRAVRGAADRAMRRAVTRN